MLDQLQRQIDAVEAAAWHHRRRARQQWRGAAGAEADRVAATGLAGQAGERRDAPGERYDAKALSPEQRQRMLDELKRLDQKLKAVPGAGAQGRQQGGKDW